MSNEIIQVNGPGYIVVESDHYHQLVTENNKLKDQVIILEKKLIELKETNESILIKLQSQYDSIDHKLNKIN